MRRMEFRFWAADNVRHMIANDGASKVAQQLLQELLAVWPRAVATMPAAFEEDSSTNQLTMRCTYEIPEPWAAADDKGRRALILIDTVTNRELASLKVARRHSPILLGRPRRVTWRATVEMPRRWFGKGWRQVLDEYDLRFTSDLEIVGRTAVMDRELVIGAWSIAADQADAYARVVAKANQNVTKLFARVQLGRIVPPSGALRWLLSKPAGSVLLLVILYILFEIVMSALNRR